MEEELKSLSKSLGGFCNHLQSSCDAFNHSLLRRPIPLDSASSTFIKSLNRRLSTAASELNFLDSMSFGTVSFEELLGHCNQIYKNNHKDLLRLQDRLIEFGYVPEMGEIDENRNEKSDFRAFGQEDSKHSGDDLEHRSIKKRITRGRSIIDINQTISSFKPYRFITLLCFLCLNDSLYLKNLGLSDACLANLASEVNDNVKDPDTSLKESVKAKSLPAPKASVLCNEDEYATPEMDITRATTITLVKEEYENLPSFMKSLASWEDLLSAVEKFNSVPSSKKETKGSYYFRADEIPTLSLGHKEKAYTVLLTRMKKLVAERVDGFVSYRVA